MNRELGQSLAAPNHTLSKKPLFLLPQTLPATAFILIATQKPTIIKPPIITENTLQDTRIIVAWKDSMVSLSLKKEMDKKLYEEKTWEKSISVGMDHAMNLLSELHKMKQIIFVDARESVQDQCLHQTLPLPS
jgi:hypothetical protein